MTILKFFCLASCYAAATGWIRPKADDQFSAPSTLFVHEPMNPIESFLIDGKSEALQSVVLPEMSLSSNRATMMRHSFAIGINAGLIGELLEPFYVALVAELRHDDSHFSEPQDALAAAGYPEF